MYSANIDNLSISSIINQMHKGCLTINYRYSRLYFQEQLEIYSLAHDYNPGKHSKKMKFTLNKTFILLISN